MAISAENNVVAVSHVVSGTGPYLFPGSLMELDDLGVYVVDEEAQTLSELALDLYTRTASSSGLKAGASVTLSASAKLDGKRLVLRRRTDLTQETEIPLAGRLSTVALEAALDRAVLRDAEIWQQLERAVRVPDGEEVPDLYALFRKFSNVANLTLEFSIGAAGSAPSAELDGNVLRLALPKPEKGDKGDKGEKGDTGATGPSYTLPTATASSLGGVRVGTGLSISSDGTLSATAGEAAWGKISGTLSDQGDLSEELSARLRVLEAVQNSTEATLTVSPGKAYRWEPSADGSLELSDEWLLAGSGECLISLNPGTHSISGGRVRIIDALEASKWNECVVRWDGYGARLYVVDCVDDGAITATDRTISDHVGNAVCVNLYDTVEVSNGEVPTFTAILQDIPSWLTISPEGVASGTPTGTYSGTVTVTVTAAHCDPVSFKVTVSITEKPAPTATVIYNLTVTSGGFPAYNDGDYVYDAATNTATCTNPSGYVADSKQRRLIYQSTTGQWRTQSSNDGSSWIVPTFGAISSPSATSDISSILGTKTWTDIGESTTCTVTVTKKQ